MKNKVEMDQSDLVELLKEKVDFLNDEYGKLYSAFTIDKKSKHIVDAVKLTESYERYLKATGDIERINNLYELFKDDKPTTTTKKKPNVSDA